MRTNLGPYSAEGSTHVLDMHHPNCGCERHSLRGLFRKPVSDNELIVRIVTAPDGYDERTNEILTARLTALFSSGVSVIRENASEAEIRSTILELTNEAAEARRLVGAVILKASNVRFLDQATRAYCVYDTRERNKAHHADIVCTRADGPSNSARKKIDERRRYALRGLMATHLHLASTADEVINLIRGARANRVLAGAGAPGGTN